jgi:hypothetical protein
MKTIYDDLGRFIHIEDNPFGTSFHEHIYEYVQNSFYRIGSQDGPAPLDTRNYVYIHSDYNEADINSLGILDKLKETEIFSPYKDLELTRCTVNLSTPSDTHFAHTHLNQISLLYYVNLRWKPEWAGETMFYNENIDEIVFSSMYKPARLIVFDGDIPHSIRPQSISAPHYRFSLAMFFNKK